MSSKLEDNCLIYVSILLLVKNISILSVKVVPLFSMAR